MVRDLNNTNEQQVNATKPRIKTLLEGVSVIETDAPSRVFRYNLAALGLTWSGEIALAQQSNPDIDIVYPEEGAIFWMENYVIPSSAQNLDAAYAWLNYTLQDDLFWLMTRDSLYINPNQASIEYMRVNQPELYSTYVESAATNPPSSVILNTQ